MSRVLRGAGGCTTSPATWVVKNIAHLMVGILFVVIIVFAFTKNGADAVGMEIVLTCLFVFLVFLCQGRFQRLRFGKEDMELILAQAAEATGEARDATKEVNEFTKAASVAVLGLIKRSGGNGGYSDDDKKQIQQDILANLGEIGISRAEIEEIEKKSRWRRDTREGGYPGGTAPWTSGT